MNNVEQWLVSRLDTVDALRGSSYPTATPVGDEKTPFAIYTMEKDTIDRDMDGTDEGVRRAKIRLDLFDDDNDRLWELVPKVRTALRCEDSEWENLYIFSAYGDLDGKGVDLRDWAYVQTIIVLVTYWDGGDGLSS